MELVLRRTLIETPLITPELDLDVLFKHAVTFNSYQSAIQVCLEALGATAEEVTVVLPVTASVDTVSAVLRSGGYPCLLDIDPGTLQIDPKLLEEVLEATANVVAVLGFPGGWDIDKALKELCDKYEIPTIIDSRLPPSHTNYGPKGTFTVYDFAPQVGGGSLVWPGHDSYRSSLLMLRSGVLGHAAHMTAPQANAVGAIDYKDFFENKVEVLSSYKDACSKFNVTLKFDHFDRFVLVEHENAKGILSKLNKLGFEASLACTPLYSFDLLRKRWAEDPSDVYPVTKRMWDRVVALPMSNVDSVSIYQIVQAIAEVL